MGRGRLRALTDPAGHGVAGTQPVVLDELVGDVNILGAGQVAGGAQVGVLVVGDVQDAGHRQEDLVLTRLVAATASATAVAGVSALAAGVAVVPVEAVASALATPTTAPPALVVVAVGLVIAVASTAGAFLGLDDGGAGGVGQVAHEGGLGVGMVLGRVGAGLARGTLLVLGGPGGGLSAPAATASLVARGALTALGAAVGVTVAGLGGFRAIAALAPSAASGPLLAGGVAAGPVGKVDTEVENR